MPDGNNPTPVSQIDIETFAEAEWSTEGLGPPLLDERSRAHLVSTLLKQGKLEQAVSGQTLRWFNAWDQAVSAMRAAIRNPEGYSWDEFLSAAAPWKERLRKLEEVRKHEIQIQLRGNFSASAKEIDCDPELLALFGDLAKRNSPESALLKQALTIIGHNESSFEERLVDAAREARVIAFEYGPDGYEFVQPDRLARVVALEETPPKECRVILTRDLPAVLTCEAQVANLGPRAPNAITREAQAARFIAEGYASGEGWRTKLDCFECVRRRFPRISGRAIERAWQSGAPESAKRAGPKPKKCTVES